VGVSCHVCGVLVCVHLSVEDVVEECLSDTVGLSDLWAALSDCRTVGLSDARYDTYDSV
jgi:hypothetical protein